MADGGLPPPPINDQPGSFTWLEWYRQLRSYISTNGSVPWYVINFAGSSLDDIAVKEHDMLDGMMGGTAGEHYHLTSAQHSALTAGPHNNLSGLQGGVAGQYYHLTSSESDIITQRSYGEMYANNAAVTTTVSVIDTWYPITSGFTAGANLNVTFQNSSELKVTKAGKYHAQWSLSTEIGTANQDTEYGLSLNGAVQNNTVAHLHFQNINSELCASSGGILTLAVNDVVKFVLRNRSTANNIKMEHASLTLVRIDN